MPFVSKQKIMRNEGYMIGIFKEIELRNITNFAKSDIYRTEIHSLIPGGAHTYSKGDDQFPSLSPAAIAHGKGSHVWDIDGNKFLDCSMGLTSVSLGHAYEPVLVAVRKEIEKGVNFQKPSYIELEIKPDSIINIPIDILFKILHTTEEKPLIKLTRNKRDEKMYRLYANKIARNGKRIPYLKKSEIKRIMKETQVEKRVMVLIHATHEVYDKGKYIEDNTVQIKCEFDNHGSIFISFKLEQPLCDFHITEIIDKSVNPVIDEVATFIGQYGYSLNNFNSL